METTPFFILLFIHLSGLILGFGSVLATDLYGLLWIWDRARFPQVVRVSRQTAKFIWAGWGIAVTADIGLVVIKGVVDNLMIVKLFFVALVGANGVVLHKLHKRVRGYQRGENVPTVTLFRLSMSLLVSQVAWWSALLIGFLHRHVQSIIEWPDRPWLLISGIVAVLFGIWVGGEVLIRRMPAAAQAAKEEITP